MAPRHASAAAPLRTPVLPGGCGEGEGMAIFHDGPPADVAPAPPHRPSGDIGCYVVLARSSGGPRPARRSQPGSSWPTSVSRGWAGAPATSPAPSGRPAGTSPPPPPRRHSGGPEAGRDPQVVSLKTFDRNATPLLIGINLNCLFPRLCDERSPADKDPDLLRGLGKKWAPLKPADPDFLRRVYFLSGSLRSPRLQESAAERP